MTHYRYRTTTLIGPWRPTRAEAERDAVAAAQARFDLAGESRLHWEVRGDIEVRQAAA